MDAKQAALYFRHVIPCGLVLELAREMSANRPFPSGIGGHLFPPHLANDLQFRTRLVAVNEATLRLFGKSWIERGRARGPIAGVSPEEYEMIEERWYDTFMSFTKEYGLVDVPIDVHGMMNEAVASGDITVTLTQLPLVDIRDAPWDQIIEFRNNVEAVRRLRRLRLFMQDNYAGKSRAYIEDDLAQRTDEYRDVAREAGFETVLGSLGYFLDSKILAGGLAGTLISTLAGEPILGALSATGTILLEMGKLSLEIRKATRERKIALDQNPVSYIAYMNERLGRQDAEPSPRPYGVPAAGSPSGQA